MLKVYFAIKSENLHEKVFAVEFKQRRCSKEQFEIVIIITVLNNVICMNGMLRR